MNRIPPAGRSGLLVACLRTDFDPRLAEFFGFESGDEPSSFERHTAGLSGVDESGQTVRAEPSSEEFRQEEKEAPTRYAPREPLKFLAEVNRIDLTEKQAKPKSNDGKTTLISDEDLAVKDVEVPPTPPLIPWKRMMPFLKLRTGVSVPGRRIHRREMARRLNAGEILTTIPQVSFRIWAPTLVVLWDSTREMWSFGDDVSYLISRLQSECGEARLQVRDRQFSDTAFLETLPPGSTVVALSAMGQLSRNRKIQQEWLCLGHRLAFRGHSLLAVSPCPSDRFNSALTRVWNSVVWDVGSRLPRFGASPFRSSSIPLESPFNLESLLAPSSYVRRGLMRKARIAMGTAANVATEYEVWHGERMHASTEVCNPLPSATTLCLRRRDQLRKTLPEMVAAINEAIVAFHGEASSPIQLETRIRLGGWEEESEAIKEGLQPIIARLQDLAKNPRSRKGLATGLANWLREFQNQLSPTLRSHTEIAALLAEGLAAADVFEKNEEATLPEGTSEKDYMRARNQLKSSDLPIRTYEVRLVEDGLEVTAVGLFERSSEGFFIATIHAQRSECLIGCEFGDGSYHAARFDLTANSNELVLYAVPDQLTITTDREVIEVEAQMKPKWANTIAYSGELIDSWNDEAPLWVESTAIAGYPMKFLHFGTSKEADDRVGYDAPLSFWRHRPRGELSHFEFISRDLYGFVATFQLEGVIFTFRWIPPGRFMMGSPEDEDGRGGDEGPKHEVEITRGYWLGTTQVTQGQWEVVMGKNPSEFKGDNRPVETVSWDDVQEYMERLKKNVSGLALRLPSEAEWEYSCRAGTEGAYGEDECTKTDGIDPALAEWGWYAGNSGNETHDVGQKKANEWGLHDMHGNVYEWCADGHRPYDREEEVDPMGSVESASRALRGGSCWSHARGCRSAYRSGTHRELRNGVIGFRLVAGQPEAVKEEKK